MAEHDGALEQKMRGAHEEEHHESHSMAYKAPHKEESAFDREMREQLEREKAEQKAGLQFTSE